MRARTAALLLGWVWLCGQTYGQGSRPRAQAGRAVTEEQKANVARGHLERGDAHALTGAFYEAISQYEQSEAVKPNSEACLHKGAVLQALRLPEAALDHYANCEAAHGSSYALYYARGVSFWSLSDTQSAMDSLHNASLLNSQIAMCLYQLGLLQDEVTPLRAGRCGYELMRPFPPLAVPTSYRACLCSQMALDERNATGRKQLGAQVSAVAIRAQMRFGVQRELGWGGGNRWVYH
jgi:tetratricopeptide (TPR) repeat protein